VVLLTARRRRVSFSGSVLLSGLTFALLGGSLHAISGRPSSAGTLLSAGVCGGLCLFMLGQFRFASVTSRGRLYVRTLFARDGVDFRACAFGVSVTSHARGGSTYTVYATDGTARAELAECWTKRGSARALRRLEKCFGVDGRDGSRAVAQTRVDTERQRVEASFASAQKQVDAYYESGAFRRAGYWLVAVVVLYTIGICLYAWLTHEKL
jgi:hypothetical protein